MILEKELEYFRQNSRNRVYVFKYLKQIIDFNFNLILMNLLIYFTLSISHFSYFFFYFFSILCNLVLLVFEIILFCYFYNICDFFRVDIF